MPGVADNGKLTIDVQIDSWDGDGTVTLSNSAGLITLDLQAAAGQLGAAITEIERHLNELGWNR